MIVLFWLHITNFKPIKGTTQKKSQILLFSSNYLNGFFVKLLKLYKICQLAVYNNLLLMSNNQIKWASIDNDHINRDNIKSSQ